MTLKVDFINGAYSQLKISGITVDPTPEDNDLALDRLEDMAEEFEARNICTGYAFEDTPDPNTPHNVERKYWQAYKTNLAVRLMPDFDKGQTADPSLIAQQQSSFSFLSSSTAPIRQTQYQSRQPVGSGNSLRRLRFRRYYQPTAQSPLGCETIKMKIDDIDDFVEHFDAYLNAGETISSYTIEADDGLTIVSSSNATPDINYRIQADGNDGAKSDALLHVKIVATTSDTRQETRIINFELQDTDVIE